MNTRYLLLITIIFFFVFCKKEEMIEKNCIIVEIQETDLEDKFEKNKFTRNEISYLVRKKLVEIIPILTQKSSYLIIDMWFPDLNPEKEKDLIEQLTKYNNVTFAFAGPENGEKEYSVLELLKYKRKLGNLWIWKSENEDYDINSFYLDHKDNFKYYHLTLLALKHLNYKINEDFITINLNQNNFHFFEKYSFNEIIKRKIHLEDKVVILIPNIFPSEDLHYIEGLGNIQGSQIMCNALIEFSKKYEKIPK